MSVLCVLRFQSYNTDVPGGAGRYISRVARNTTKQKWPAECGRSRSLAESAVRKADKRPRTATFYVISTPLLPEVLQEQIHGSILPNT